MTLENNKHYLDASQRDKVLLKLPKKITTRTASKEHGTETGEDTGNEPAILHQPVDNLQRFTDCSSRGRVRHCVFNLSDFVPLT